MNNYPDCLISAIKGLQNDYKISEIITEFFKENSESELKKKLNLLEKQFNKDIISDFLFNYEKYHSSNTINSVKPFASQSKINNIENNKVFDSNKNINTESDVSPSILEKEKKVKFIGKEQDFLNKKKKREFNNENKSTEKKQSENKNKSKKKLKIKLKLKN